jgi:Tn7-like transposition protein D/TniQ protein
MIGYFPTAYPDELLYSICARFGELVDYRSKLAVHVDLFGNKGNTAIVDLPSHLGYLIANLPPGHPHTVDRLIDDYTLFRYYAPFLEVKRAARIRQLMSGSSSLAVQTYVGRNSGKIHPPYSLRYCPQCVVEDRKIYGECYWHRLHQATGVEVCPRHACFLEDSSERVHNRVNPSWYVPAEKAVMSLAPRRVDLAATDHRMLMKIAKDVAWLLEYNKGVPGLNALFTRYKSILTDYGLITACGKTRGRSMLELFKSFYTPSLISLLKCDIGKRTQIAWPRLLISLLNQNTTAHPLRHLLLIHFFEYSAKTFFSRLEERKSSPQRSIPPPFGAGPWPCLNPVADHFRLPVIESCRVVNHKMRNIPVGIFKCDCGFIYTRNGPDTAPEDRFKISRVKAYGQVWEEALMQMWKDSSISLPQISRRLNITQNGVKYRAYCLDLTFPRPGPIYSAQSHPDIRKRIKKTQAKRRNKLANNRARWLAVRKEHPDATRSELYSTIASGIYRWLSKYDKEWFQSHLPPSRKNAKGNKQIDWESRDMQLAEAILRASIRMQTAAGRPVRTTKRAIIIEIDENGGLLSKSFIKRLPRTAQALNEAVETSDQFSIRRIKWAVESFREEGVSPSRRNMWKRVCIGKKSQASPIVVAAFEEAWRSLQ